MPGVLAGLSDFMCPFQVMVAVYWPVGHLSCLGPGTRRHRAPTRTILTNMWK